MGDPPMGDPPRPAAPMSGEACAAADRCPICGESVTGSARVSAGTAEVSVVDCPRCGQFLVPSGVRLLLELATEGHSGALAVSERVAREHHRTGRRVRISHDHLVRVEVVSFEPK